MAFNLKNIYEVFGHNKEFSNGDRIVVEKKMSKKVLGQMPRGCKLIHIVVHGKILKM